MCVCVKLMVVSTYDYVLMSYVLMWLMACQTIEPRNLKFGTHIQLDPRSNLVDGGGGGGAILRRQHPKN